jgi:hypothetical protein
MKHSSTTALGSGATCLALLSVVLLSPSAARATTPAEYRAAVADAAQKARQAAKEPDREAAVALLREARSRFPRAVVVPGDDGARITVSNRDLARSLDRALGAGTATKQREDARQFLQRAEMLQAALDAPAPSRTAAETAALKAILGRAEFQPPPLERWETGVREWLRSLLRRLFGNVQPASLNVMSESLYWLLLACAVLLFAYLIWNYVPHLRFRRTTRVARLDTGGAIETPDTAGAHLAAADAAAAAGRYLDALRHTYTAMLLRLDAANVVPFDRARTNREVLRALRGGAQGSIRDLLRPIILALDEKLYGGRPATADDYRLCRDEYGRLEGLLAP